MKILNKIIIFFLAINILNCLSFEKGINFEKVNISQNFFERDLVQKALKKYDLNIKLHFVKTKDDFDFFNLKNTKNYYFIYFYDQNTSAHLGKRSFSSSYWGEYILGNNFIFINKKELLKMNKNKQLGVVTHELGHFLGLKHILNDNCNFMLGGVDNCNSYTYEQVSLPKKYLSGSLKIKELN